MASVKVVTGYIEIPGHPRTAEEYKPLGEKLLAAIEPYEGLVFDHPSQTVEGTFLYRQLQQVPNLGHSVADNPAKNTLAYHCVQHQKFEWIRAAAALDKDDPAEIYVWLDYGIFHVSGITPEIIQHFLLHADSYGHAVRMPGCWPKGLEINPAQPHWRFCGSVMAVPRPLVRAFTANALAIAARHAMSTKVVDWEVNTLARLELTELVPISWYQADHNETMFTGVK